MPRIQQGATRMIDEATISPKVAIPTVLLALAGLAVCILDQLGILTVDDSLWIALLSAGGVTGVTGYSARPGAVIPDTEAARSSWGKEAGFADSRFLLGALTVAVIVLLVIVLT